MKKTIINSACALALLSGTALYAAAPTVTVTEHLVPTNNAAPFGIVAGATAILPANQVMWFTEMNTNKIATMDQNGKLTEYALTAQNIKPTEIALGADNKVWFIGQGIDANKPSYVLHFDGTDIGEFYQVPKGVPIRIQPINTKIDDNQVAILTTRTSADPASIIKLKYDKTVPGRIVATTYATKITSDVSGFAIDANNDFLYGSWGADVNQINLMTITGSPGSPYIINAKTGIKFITTAKDGTVWFTTGDGRIGKVTLPDHAISLYAAPNIGEGGALTEGPDGAIWFTEYGKDGADSKIARLDPLDPAHITETKTPTASTLGRIALSYDGKGLWFTETSANKIAQITLS